MLVRTRDVCVCRRCRSDRQEGRQQEVNRCHAEVALSKPPNKQAIVLMPAGTLFPYQLSWKGVIDRITDYGFIWALATNADQLGCTAHAAQNYRVSGGPLEF